MSSDQSVIEVDRWVTEWGWTVESRHVASLAESGMDLEQIADATGIGWYGDIKKMCKRWGVPVVKPRKLYVYGLLCPATEKVMYVGLTEDPLRRVMEHARRPVGTVKRWLDAAGHRSPGIDLFEWVPRARGREREKHWIAYHQERGAAELNVRVG